MVLDNQGIFCPIFSGARDMIKAHSSRYRTACPGARTTRIQEAWAVHQTGNTADFARSSRLLSWLLGGLNFQIEHHLFPTICHVNYLYISDVVEKTCREFGAPYHTHPTFCSALASHFRWLRRMGRGEDLG